jgi:hypothetical protein
MIRSPQSLLQLVVLSVLAAGCSSETSPTPTGNEESDPPVETPVNWEPGNESKACNVDALLPPATYGRKVKSLLTGLPVSEAEAESLVSNPEALPELIDTWLATPEGAEMLQRFFMTYFQQTSTNNDSLFYLLGRKVQSFGKFDSDSASTAALLNRNLAESFARTMVDLVSRGEPFTKALTTDEFMMTTAQVALLAYLDDETVDDFGAHDVRSSTNTFDTMVFYKNQANAPAAKDALDPTSPSFGHFWHRELADVPASCNVGATLTVDTSQITNGEWRMAGNTTPSFWVFSAMMGRHFGINVQGDADCRAPSANNNFPLFKRSDFNDWHLVKVRKPSADEAVTPFYDLEQLRTASELVVHTERVGFLTSPGFFSTWMNNEDNSSRVTVNQALIVALGKSFEGQAVTNFAPESLDAEHADPTTECYGCHQTLDPMRDFYRASFTNYYGEQLDPERAALQADFIFDGVTAKGNGVRDLADLLAEHPAFPYAWAHKLCYMANAAPCLEGATLDGIVASFVESSFDFRVLVRELFSSPLVTASQCVEGVDTGSNVSIARRTLFCSELSHRLDINDVCGLGRLKEESSALQNSARDASGSIPDDGFSRAVVSPIVIAETGLFTRANAEATCVTIAQESFNRVYQDLTTDEATLHMVSSVMGLPPNDELHAPSLAILRAHVEEAVAEGKTDRDAVESAFVIACMSPTVAGVGF